jgi:hypothetical protein
VLEDGPLPGVGLAEAIESLRDALLTARRGAAGAEIQLPVESITVELKVVATKTMGGKAGFRVPVVGVELNALD